MQWCFPVGLFRAFLADSLNCHCIFADFLMSLCFVWTPVLVHVRIKVLVCPYVSYKLLSCFWQEPVAEVGGIGKRKWSKLRGLLLFPPSASQRCTWMPTILMLDYRILRDCLQEFEAGFSMKIHSVLVFFRVAEIVNFILIPYTYRMEICFKNYWQFIFMLIPRILSTCFCFLPYSKMPSVCICCQY